MAPTNPVLTRVERNERAQKMLDDTSYVGKKYRKKSADNPQEADSEIPNKFEIQVKKEKKPWKTIKVHDNEKAAASHYRRTQVGPGISKRILVNGKVAHTEEGK